MVLTGAFEQEWEFEGGPYSSGLLQEVAKAAPRRTPATPVFRFSCASGCHFGNEQACRRILRTAIVDAIGLASGAAAALANPSKDTQSKFLATFGHLPSRPVSWAGGASSGSIVARRYQLALRALRLRGTLYRCDSTLTNFNALTINPNEVSLGPSFWKQGQRMDRAGTILHEMMHQYFLEFILHDKREHRRNNANCLHAFAFRVRNLPVPEFYAKLCRDRPA
jgi:hypothetical protein